MLPLLPMLLPLLPLLLPLLPLLPLLLIDLHLHAGQRLAMKLIDRFAHLAQGLTQLLLFLSLDRDLNQRNNSERQNRQHGDRDYQFDK